MKNIHFVYSVILFAFVNFTIAQTNVPYKAKVQSTNGTQIGSYRARICSSGGTATLKATAGWPFGAGYLTYKYLHVTNGNTFHIACGAVADFDSIRIEAGGTVIIDDYVPGLPSNQTGTPWTIIGCKGTFVLDGTIIATNGTHTGGTWQLMEPDSLGNLTIPSQTTTIIQKNGGNGGVGGQSHEINGGGCGQPGGAMGPNQYGNGGGGGGGAGMCSNPGSCSAGDSGRAATINSSGDGGHCSWFTVLTPGVSVYGQDGNFGSDCNSVGSCNCCSASSNGGSGGTRGKHGGLLFIKSMKSILGTGTIDVGGQNGGKGGDTYAAGGASGSYYSGAGGGGGGAAGGSGGYLFLKYAGTAPTIAINKAAGTGGSGGISSVNGASISPGANGIDGEAGLAGQQSVSQLNPGLTFQWYKNFTTLLSGRIYDTLNVNATGYYHCKITDEIGVHKTNYDTVQVEAAPIATITQHPTNNAICASTSGLFVAQAQSGQTYQWYEQVSGFPTGPNDTLNTFSTSLAGTYYVEVNNSCHNPATSTPITLTVNPNPTPSIISLTGNDTICQGSTTQLHSSTATGISWNTGAVTPTITVDTGGVYVVTVTDANSCTASTSQTITMLPAIVNAGNDTALACGFNLTLQALTNPATPTAISWSPNTYLSNSSIANPLCTPTANTTYTVTANFSNGCSASDVINVTSNPAANPTVCVVTVDTGSVHNIIVWDKTSFTNAVSQFKVYRDYPVNPLPIATIPFDSLSQYIDTAIAGDPNNGSRKYSITLIDTCGNESVQSDQHRPVFIAFGAQPQDFNIQVSYQINGTTPGYLTYYTLYQDKFGNGASWDSINYVTVGSPSISAPLSGPDNFNNFPNARYRVEPNFATNCTPTYKAGSGNNNTMVTVTKSRSNIRNNRTVGVKTVYATTETAYIYPNPSNNELTVELSNNCNNCKIEIVNVLGTTVRSVNINTAQSTVNTSDLDNGIYYIKISSNNKAVALQKLVVQH